MLDQKAAKIFEVMIERGLIPKEGIFEVTDSLREHSFNIYREIFPPKRKRLPKTSEIKLSKKLAGLNMMKLNEIRFLQSQAEKVVVKKNSLKQECGFVYIITNPAFPNLYKIGITKNIEARLSTYQTCDPYRKYKVEHYRFVTNRAETEKFILNKFKLDIITGEWISNDKVKEILASFE